MFLWIAIGTISSKPHPPPPPPTDIFSISTIYILLILVCIALLSFGLGVLFAEKIRSGRKKVEVLAPPFMDPPHRKLNIAPPVKPPTNVPQPANEDPSHNKRWVGLVEENVELFDELDTLSSQVDPPRQEMIRHVKNRLREILARSGVEVISRDASFDSYRHQAVQSNRNVQAGTPVAECISPGFAINGRVLRPARVRVVGDT